VNVRLLLASLVGSVLIGATLLSAGAAVAECKPPPKFEVTFDPGSAPELPDPPWTRPLLEKFRSELERFRKLDVEAYNASVTNYVEDLHRYERSILRAKEAGLCAEPEFALVHGDLVDAFDRASKDLLWPYDLGVGIYKEVYSSYLRAVDRVRHCEKFGCDEIDI
jgi:hypothetical protein